MNKKILSAIIAAALAASPAAVFAEATTDVAMDEPAVIEMAETMPSYITATMTVEAVEDGNVTLKGEEDATINLNITPSTLIIDSEGNRLEEIKAGDSVTYFVNGNTPAPLIFPPVYTPDVVVVNEKNGENKAMVTVDTFRIENGELMSSDGQLIINADPTVIERADGGIVTKESLEGKNLCVIYSMMTMSIPAQTNPDKVYILSNQNEVVELPEDTEDVIEDVVEDAVTVPEVTNKISANGGEAFEISLVEINGVQMLPVRAVSEALGLEVSYDDTLQAVTVGTTAMGVNFAIGSNSYNKSRMMPFMLSHAPVKVIFEETGVTYVPVEFFTEILGAQITVDGGITAIDRQ